MTNFEKWKKELKPEDFIKYINNCEDCPASKEFCLRYDEDCEDAFLAWAEGSAEE